MKKQAAGTAQWQRHLRRARSSGLSLREYCRQNELSPQRLYYWRRRLSLAAPAGAGAFVAVSAAAGPTPALLRVTLPGGLLIEATASVEAGVISDLVHRLRNVP